MSPIVRLNPSPEGTRTGPPQPGVVDADLARKSPADMCCDVVCSAVARQGTSGSCETDKSLWKVPPVLGGQQFSNSWPKQQDSTQKVQKKGTVQRLTTKTALHRSKPIKTTSPQC